MNRTTKREQGFTLLEAVVVIGIMFTVMAIAVVQSFGSMQNYEANSSLDIVASQLRLAREVAITQRRNVQIFITTNPGAGNPQLISYQQLPAPGSGEPLGQLISAPLPMQAPITLIPGVPDTPMNFGNSSAVYIGNTSGGPPVMEFTSTGQFTDSTGFNTLNGTIFLGVPGLPATARAVTIMGGTGRVRPYSYMGNNVWTE
jgi:type II secretory pathway pseudopilin PulG